MANYLTEENHAFDSLKELYQGNTANLDQSHSSQNKLYCKESLQRYKLHRLEILFRIKIISRDSAKKFIPSLFTLPKTTKPIFFPLLFFKESTGNAFFPN